MQAEIALASPIHDAKSHPVEVSGWDAEGQFFVEITDLGVTDSDDLTASLYHRVNDGSLVFVRLLCDRSADGRVRSHPTANEAHTSGEPDLAGRCIIRLTPCQPRPARRFGDQKRTTRI